MKDEYDFSGAKRGAVVSSTKERITIRLDPDVLAWFREQASDGGSYQALINAALREHITQSDRPRLDEDTLRRVLREELRAGPES